MAIFAVVTDNLIQNIVEAEDALPLQLMFEDSSIIAVTEITGPAHIGSEVIGGKFAPLQPFESWILDRETVTWNAPVEKPNSENLQFWNEESQSWMEIDPNAIVDLSAEGEPTN